MATKTREKQFEVVLTYNIEFKRRVTARTEAQAIRKVSERVEGKPINPKRKWREEHPQVRER